MPKLACPLVLLGCLLAPATAPAGIDPAEYRGRRERLVQLLGDDFVAVLVAAGDAEPFRQDPSFLYLTGVDEPDAVLVLEPGTDGHQETLYLKPRDRSRERWDGATLDPGDIDPASGEPDDARRRTQERTGVKQVRARPALGADLRLALSRRPALHLAADPVALDAPLTPALELWRDLRDRSPGVELRRLRTPLVQLRAVKSPAELDAIERAVAVTMEAHRELAGLLRPGVKEYEAKARLEYVFRRGGARGPSFPSIVASGPNATVLHYRGDSREMQTGELVLVDIGADWEGYAADVSRTFPVDGRFSERQRQVYDAVLAAQEAAFRAIRPGAKLRSDVHAAAKKSIEEAGFTGKFPHGTSHYVGLEVHDVGERDGPLAPGMVITVEPGIYLPDEGIGVRIEDMVVVTKDGYRLLTAALPRTAAAVEELMRSRRAPAASAVP